MLKTTNSQSGFSKHWTNELNHYTKMCPCLTREGKARGTRDKAQARHKRGKQHGVGEILKAAERSDLFAASNGERP